MPLPVTVLRTLQQSQMQSSIFVVVFVVYNIMDIKPVINKFGMSTKEEEINKQQPLLDLQVRTGVLSALAMLSKSIFNVGGWTSSNSMVTSTGLFGGTNVGIPVLP
jgi:hypothetical protein